MDFPLVGGVMMPKIGLGTYPFKGSDGERALGDALDCGYRLIDTAYAYGNHDIIGNTIKARLDSGNLKREDIFITSKVPGHFMGSAELVRRCVELSVKALQLDYVDLFLLHGPCGIEYEADDNFQPKNADGKTKYLQCDLVQAWKGLEECVNRGLTKSIGVSNFNIHQLQKIIKEARIPIANLQVECHAYLQQQTLVELCKQNNIVVTAYAPLGNPGKDSKSDRVIADATVAGLASKYGKTPAQILLNFLLSENIAVIPKSSNKSRMEENFQATSFSFEDGDIQKLRLLDRGLRYYDLIKFWGGHPDYPFDEEFDDSSKL